MRFSLYVLIFCSSILYSQTTIFVKYKTIEEAESGVTNLREKISQQELSKTTGTSQSQQRIYQLKEQFRNLNQSLQKIIKLEIPNDVNIDEFINDLTQSSSVEYVQKANTYSIDYEPQDSLYPQQWALNSINATDAWDLIENDEEIIIAIIDTGIDFDHPDIDSKIFKNSGESGIDSNGNDKSNNGIDDDENGFIDDYQGWDFVNKIDINPIEPDDDFTDWDNIPMDEHGHGTNMAGIIAAEHNTFGIAGVNPNAKILNIRAFDKNGNGEEDDAAAAIIYAVNMGAKIINMSWGDNLYSNVLRDVIKYAYENDVVLIGSSGNSGTDTPHYPSGFSEVISVGAIQENENAAGFSNFGSTLDLVAPGSQILTLNLDNTYKQVSGTSASTPFVSGTAALIHSFNKDFSPEDIKQILKTTTKDLGETGWDDKYGSGLLNMNKALSILSPSSIKFNYPTQDYYTQSDLLKINITCLSPYFSNYKLYYGIGTNPNSWEYLETESEEFQKLNEDVFDLDVSSFQDTSYTLRILVNRTDGNTQEERINFHINRSEPNVLIYNIFPALLNDSETIQASVITDDRTIAKLYYRELNSNGEFNFISMDGLTSDQYLFSVEHFGIVPINETVGGINHELYLEVTNGSGLKTIIRDENDNNFILTNSLSSNIGISSVKSYELPNGRIYNAPVSLNGIENNFVLLNEESTSEDISIYKFDIQDFSLSSTLKNRIPIGSGDFNEDDRTDLLNLFVKNGFIDSQINSGEVEFNKSFADSSGSFWPSLAEDIDNDSKTEIIAFTNDSTLTIWEVNSDLSITKEIALTNIVTEQAKISSIFRNNICLVDNFDDDLQDEIAVVDNYGRLILFEIEGDRQYKNDKIIEHFYPLESNSTITKGDFNGDGITDIGIVMEFEENVYLTPLIYTSVFTITSDGIEFLFQNMFISTENSFVASFSKQYRAINFEDVNSNGTDDLILFTYPNAYIFEYGEEQNEMIFYQPDVNTQSVFVGDLDANGVKEIGIPFGDKFRFHEFLEDNKLPAPLVKDYYSIDSNKVYFEWVNEGRYKTYIFKQGSDGNFILYDSTLGTNYSDLVNPNKYQSYYLHFAYSDTIISHKSKIIEIFPHAPTIIIDQKAVSNKQLEITFSNELVTQEIRNNFFIPQQDFNISSIAQPSNSSFLINFANPLLNDTYSLLVKNVRDIYNTPIKDTLLSFQINDAKEDKNHLHISSYSIISNNVLEVTFNFNIDSITALNKNNYIFSPNNDVVKLGIVDGSKNKIVLGTKQPFGSIGREYVLKVRNIFSSIESGYLPISSTSGSEIVLTSEADDLDEIYVYPNPIKFSEHQFLTFANLPNRVDIYIYSLDGKFINQISETDGNGGIDWNLLDEDGNSISSGIYIYKAISFDNFDETIQEKIGKFAVIK